MDEDEEYHINILRSDTPDYAPFNKNIFSNFKQEKLKEEIKNKDLIDEIKSNLNEKIPTTGKFLTPIPTITRQSKSPNKYSEFKKSIRCLSPKHVIEKKIIDGMKNKMDFDSLYNLLISQEILAEENVPDKSTSLNNIEKIVTSNN